MRVPAGHQRVVWLTGLVVASLDSLVVAALVSLVVAALVSLVAAAPGRNHNPALLLLLLTKPTTTNLSTGLTRHHDTNS